MILWKVKLPPPYQQNTDGIMAVAGPLLTVTELKKKKKRNSGINIPDGKRTAYLDGHKFNRTIPLYTYK